MPDLEDKAGPHPRNDKTEQKEPSSPSLPTSDQNIRGDDRTQPGQGKQLNEPPMQQWMRLLQRYYPSTQAMRNTLTSQVLWNILVSIATIFLTLITYWQYKLGRETFSISRLDQRPWVGPGTVSHPEVRDGFNTTFGVEHINSGKTPALNVRHIIGGQILLKNSPLSIVYQDAATPSVASSVRDSVGIVQPGMTTWMVVPSGSIPQERIAKLRSGETVLYLYGEVSYDDVFGDSHCTTYCYYFSRNLERPSRCGTYNEIKDTRCDNTD